MSELDNVRKRINELAISPDGKLYIPLQDVKFLLTTIAELEEEISRVAVFLAIHGVSGYEFVEEGVINEDSKT